MSDLDRKQTSATGYLGLIKDAALAWDKHEAPRLGAALAFYTILSLSPLVVLILALMSLVVDRGSAQTEIVNQTKWLLGDKGGEAVQFLLGNNRQPAAGWGAWVVGVGTLLFGASGVFLELRSALNKIWEVPDSGKGRLQGFIRERFLSFGMVLSMGFLLLVSLLLSAFLAAAGKFVGGVMPGPTFASNMIGFVMALLGISVLFGLIFKFVPTTYVRWRDVRLGAFLTALLFTLGKTIMVRHLGRSVGSPYGAAGSLIVVTAWVYYSAQIFFFGAEFTRASSLRAGDGGGSEREPLSIQGSKDH
jgi:membrane protein